MRDRDTERYYRARAAEYEQIYYRDVPDRRREIDEACARLQKLVAGRTVLDLACGTGYWTRVIAETAARITAVDVAPEMLSEARKKPYPADVEFVEGDMFELTYPEAFEVVSVGFWFSHQPRQEYEAFFDLVSASLAPGGRIWLIDNNPPAEGSRLESVRVDGYGNNYKKRYLDRGDEYTILKNYFDKDELAKIFRRTFDLQRLDYGTYYWSLVMTPR
jgi:demethylmenaquinone methyltransferase/2-methoxy-6-polyprenyl-1,4-benzoquinol methylase